MPLHLLALSHLADPRHLEDLGSLVLAAAKTTKKTSSSGSSFILILIVIMVAGYFLWLRPQRRRQQAVQRQQQQAEVGDEVVTASGIYGRVVAVHDDRVSLEIAPGTTIEIAKRALGQRVSTPALGDDPAGAYGGAQDGPDGDDPDAVGADTDGAEHGQAASDEGAEGEAGGGDEEAGPAPAPDGAFEVSGDWKSFDGAGSNGASAGEPAADAGPAPQASTRSRGGAGAQRRRRGGTS